MEQGANWIWTQPGPRSRAGSLASAGPLNWTRLRGALTPEAVAAAPYLWRLWARADQLAPSGDWTTWVVLGGRGAGKTRAGAEWLRGEVEGSTPLAPGRRRRVALVAGDLIEAREIMVTGPSGLLAVSPPDRRPNFIASRRRLEWPNGAVAQIFSAEDPDALRGPQFDGAWSDEIAKWPRLRETWDMLQFALRLGERPRQVATTTPRPRPELKAIMAAPGTVVSHAPTAANRAHLAPGFLDAVVGRYAGSALGRQELEGLFVEEAPGALWTRAMLEAARQETAPEVARIVVAVDPPVGVGEGADACGVVVAGRAARPDAHGRARAVILADRTARGERPTEWAARVARAAAEFDADRIVAEANQGGEMVRAVLEQVAPNLPIKLVRASRAKAARAEPVAALYEQGRVVHGGAFPELEEELRRFTPEGYQGPRSPDRADALVWALSELLLNAPAAAPRMRAM